MEPEAMIIIEELGKIVSQNTSQIVTYYTKWHILSALGWIAFGAFFMIAAKKAPTPEGFQAPAPVICRTVAFVIGFAIVVGNFPDVFSPEAYAIHQLILDIRGH